MSVLCLHALVPEGATPAPEPVHARIPLGPVTALVSAMPEALADEGASLDALLSHDLLLGCYLAQGPVLPVRFGSCFRDEDALREALAPQAEALAGRLAALDGLAEYALTVEPGAAPAPAPEPAEKPASGRAFLKARKAQRDGRAEAGQVRADALRALHDRACALARESDLRPPRPPRLLSLSLLMQPAQAERLRGELQDWSRRTGPTARLTGPFPAYSFADLGATGAGHG